MRRALLIAGGVIAALVVLLLVVVAMQPKDVHVERSKTVAATPAQVWPHISDMRAMQAWSPWNELDPDQAMAFSDATSGVGAWYTWEGNDDVGKGKMAITAVEPNTKITHDLEFIEPFASQAVITTTLASVEGGTRVTWGFDSQNGFMGKAASLFMDMDSMLGADFEKGLGLLDGVVAADLAAQAEKAKEEAQAEPEGEATAEGDEPTEAATP